MMRAAVLFMVCASFGCGNGDGSNNSQQSQADLAQFFDPAPGSAGSSCISACDCNPGLSCGNGRCGTGGPANYCCTSTSCPSGSACQHSNGTVSTCASTGGGTPGGGGGLPGGGGGLPGGGLPGGGLPGIDLDAGIPGFGFGDGGLPILGDGGAGGGLCGLVSCTTDADCGAGLGAFLGCTTCDTTAGTCL